MSQVFVNLLKNATEALLTQDCNSKTTIRSTIDTEERIQIEITDNGSAIPAEVTENIFTPFFTPKPTAQASVSPSLAKSSASTAAPSA